MAKFSERHGYSPVPQDMVPESITDDLRNLLWNVIDQSISGKDLGSVTLALWHDFYKKPLDERPYSSGYSGISYAKSWLQVRGIYFAAPWFSVYDHVEFFAERRLVASEAFNRIFAQEGAAYRVIDKKVCQITDQAEIDTVSEGFEHGGKFKPVAEHLKAALVLLSQRQNPDYRNSIKESILSVESMARILIGDDKATLGKVLNKLEADGKINGALKQGFTSIYGWTSDTNGIRHAMTDVSSVGQAEAKFFLIACSAFANYLKVVGL